MNDLDAATVAGGALRFLKRVEMGLISCLQSNATQESYQD
jgi:hypothetical protein